MNPIKTLLALGLLAASLQPLAAADPTADQILRRMSEKLAAEKSFRFLAVRKIDPALLEGGQALPEKAFVAVSVMRPNKLASLSVSKTGTRHMVADGQTLSLLNKETSHYTTVPMRKSIDGLITELDEKYGFMPPLIEFAVSDLYADFRRQAHTITSLGRVKVGAGFLGLGGIECDHLLLKGKVADAELWIGVKDHLPHQFVATFHRDGQPQVRARFLEWDLAARATPADFTFTPPKGAQKIEMWTAAKMKAARQP